MAKLRNLKGSMKRGGRWKQRIIWSVLAVIFLMCGTLYYVSRPARLAQITTVFIENITGAKADIKEAFLRRDGRIELTDVKLWVPGRTDEGGKLASIQDVVIDPDMFALMTGRFYVESIKLIQPAIYVTEDLDEQKINLAMLKKEDENISDKTGGFFIPQSVPQVMIREASVIIGEYESGIYTEKQKIDIEGRINKTKLSTGGYYFLLRQLAEPGEKAPSFEGNFNLRKKSFSVSLQGLDFRSEEQIYLPTDIREWWKRLNILGDVPLMKLSYTPQNRLSSGY